MNYIEVILLVAIAVATLAFMLGRKTQPTTYIMNSDVPASNSSSAAHSEELAWVKVYEVFLSFCGKDTRNGFTDFLYTYLKDASIETFRDHNELRFGEKIGSELVKAIRESKISIPVFSKNYAFSKWCLLELEEMVDCHINGGLMIYPIFYDVAPFEVRHQYGSYEKAFQEHEKKFDKEIVKRWREALRMVGELKGLELKETNGQEGKLVKMVVEKVLLYLKKNYTVLPENLVGIDVHLENLKELLELDFGGARVVVIHGMGGLGKTTIVKAAFNQLHDMFDNHCFLDNVREKSEHGDGILDLQNQLISKIQSKGFLKLANANEGRDIIKGTVRGRKVLIVLDDIDRISQVNMLMGNLSWYGAQSRIIITTRDTDVLRAIERTCQIEGLKDVCTGYKPEYMNEHESLQLFSKYAFMRDCPAKGYEQLCDEVITIAAGLPLVLVVLGSTFFVVEGKDLWNEKLSKLREMPHEEVIDKLRFSFDALENTQKQIFLDIACFFIGWDLTTPVYMWDDCRFYPRDGINVLVRKSLITVNEDNVLGMHDQLRDLGRQIVREESVNELGKQSRLWRTEEAMQILETNQGTASVNVLRLPESISPVLASSFNNIPNLRYLDMGRKYLEGDFKDLCCLRWLTISNFREGSSTNLHFKNLVILNLAHEFRDFKMGEKLKVLELSECHSVRVLPDLSMHPSLEILRLSFCSSLRAVEGLEMLKSLKCLDLCECPALEKLCLSNLTNLYKLCLYNCNQLTEIQGLEKLESLQDLLIYECPSLKELPDLSNLIRLEKIDVNSNVNLIEIKGLEKLELLSYLEISDCKSLEMLPNFSNMKKLEYIGARGCLKLKEINGLEKLELLRGLDITDCESLERLPDFSNSKLLKNIHADGCSKLIEIKGLGKLVLSNVLCLKYCTSLERLPYLSNTLKEINVKGCAKLLEIEGMEKLELLEDLCMEDCRSLEKLPDLSYLKKLKTLNVKGCVKLVKIEGLEKLELLEDLCLENCSSLEWLPDFSNLKKLKNIKANGCTKAVEIQGLEKLGSLQVLELRECRSLKGTIYLSNFGKLKVFHVPTLELTNFDCLNTLNELEIAFEDNLLKFQGFNAYGWRVSGESMIGLLIDEIEDLVGLDFLEKTHRFQDLIEIRGLDSLEFPTYLDLTNCSYLKRISNLPNFRTLKRIEVKFCDELDEVEGLVLIESLESLVIRCCYKIRQIPDLRNLKNLKILSLTFLKLISIDGLDELQCLEHLNIVGCMLIETLPDLSNLVNLATLNACGCARLTGIRGLEKMKSLTWLDVTECKSLVTLPDFSNLKKLIKLDASGCVRLSKITGLEKLTSLEWLNIDGCKSIEALPDLTIRSLLGLPNTVVQRTHTIYVDKMDLVPNYETSDACTSSMIEMKKHVPSTWLGDSLNSVSKHSKNSSSVTEMKHNAPQTWLGLGLTSNGEEILDI